jgi:2,3-bisphosphoglycerate-dependent phosphoglycerate mutase
VLTDLFLVRHGLADKHTGVPYHTPPGPGLTDVGRDHARQAALFLSDQRIEHLFVSSFVRTRQTADEMGSVLHLPILYDEALIEHGLQEPAERVQARMLVFVQRLEQQAYSRVALVSHGSPIKHLLLALTGGQVDMSGYMDEQHNPLPPGGIWHARRSAGIWQAALVFQPK